MNEAIVELNNVVYSYPGESFILNAPNLCINRGSKTALIGSSGCGKTTLANLIGGIHLPLQGSIRIQGETISEMSEAQRRDFRISKIGFIFQEFELLDHLNLEENIQLPYFVNTSMTLTPEVRNRAKELCETVGLGKKLKRRPNELSQGEKQRLAICRALLTHPPLVIADEPTGNLDPDNTRSIMELISSQVESRGLTLIMITHDRSLLTYFDQIVDLNERPS